MNTSKTEAGQGAQHWSLYSPSQRWRFLTVLFLVSTSNVVDRQVITVLLEPFKEEFVVSDTLISFLTGLSFALFHVILGIPIARLADWRNRKVTIGVCLSIWSLMTVLCGMA